MHKLLYNDIRNLTIRNNILNHIIKHAKEQKAHSLIRTREGKRRHIFPWRKILSDVDDTLICSGGSYPAGVDTSYPSKAIYPGVLAFYRELDLGPLGPEIWEPKKRLGNLVFLSARPHVYKDISEGPTFQKMLNLQETRGLHAPPALLAGSLDTGGKYMWEDNPEPLAQKKYQNYREYMTLYPEYTSVLIGDNGQGDARVAEMVLQDPEFRDKLDRVYIHVVKSLRTTYVSNPTILQPLQPQIMQLQANKTTGVPREKICYFKTYIDAAIDAYEHNLIKLSGLRSVMIEAVADFKAIPLSDWMKVSNGSLAWTYIKETRQREINTAINKGNQILLSKGLSDVKPIRIDCQYPIGKPVVTKFGLGIVINYRPSDGIYEVSMQWDITGENKPVIGYFNSSVLRHVHFTCISPIVSIAPSKRAVNQPNLKIFLTFPWKISYSTPTTITTITNKPIDKVVKEKQKIENVDVDKYLTRYQTRYRNLLDLKCRQRLPLSLYLWEIEGSDKTYLNCYIRRELVGPTRVPVILSNCSTPREETSAITQKSKVVPRPIIDASTPMKEIDKIVDSTTVSKKTGSQVNSLREFLTPTRARARSSSSGSVSTASNQLISAVSPIIGSIGWTRYGYVYVMNYRPKDDMLVVKYTNWIGFGYMRRGDVIQVTDTSSTKLHQIELELESEYNAVVRSVDINETKSNNDKPIALSIRGLTDWLYSQPIQMNINHNVPIQSIQSQAKETESLLESKDKDSLESSWIKIDVSS
eukprot:CAMPEP_0196763812 /NCGR_PEP_ID=MMETSP1095-20130614/4828_1 /TAXON_ID=96789 ORGANISM="Chromulina nebulosa, Strain UTEXLB2642" /NCGR_SAMPLE_ID=MMETSP1095 /ASSEMBLY_ACC=CAM_ASM_000446 /LENGTH=754 /DNA_ID=CAMNT_0042117865 /DNA_START=259 /DNA_END=2520 /DNA_ORIENTATION=+